MNSLNAQAGNTSDVSLLHSLSREAHTGPRGLLQRLARDAQGAPLQLERLAAGCFAVIELHNRFFNDPSTAEKWWAGDSLDMKWAKGGETEKGIFWDSLAWPSHNLLQCAGAGAGTKLMDCGSGTGETNVAMSLLLGVDVTAVEYDKDFHEYSRDFQSWLEQIGLPTPGLNFVCSDFLDVDMSGQDVLFYFNHGTFKPDLLEQKVLRDLKKGARFVVFHYSDKQDSYPFDKLREELDFRREEDGAIFTRV